MTQSKETQAIPSMLPHIQALETYEGVDPMEVMAERAGIPPEKIIRLNGNENPYGPSPKVAEALGSYQNFNYYPDPGQRNLRRVLAGYLKVEPDQIVAGNGSDELIDLLLRMYVGVGDNVITPSPTFGMYSFSAGICGGRAIPVERDGNFEIDLEAMKAAITSKSKIIFLTSPNNPTGNLVPEAQTRALLDTGLLVVMDEAYFEFCGETAIPMLSEYRNLVVLRTFSKWAGLAGLRIGVGAMDPEVAATMMAMKPPYSVNLAAEVALTTSLEDTPGLLVRVEQIVTERDRMIELLRQIPGLTPLPSQANFILCQVPEGRGKEIFDGLSSRGIFLRYWGNGRLKDYIRTSIGLPHETDAVVEAFAELCA
ncbi:MAG: histidinol-phosphate transaminase [SAR202 cluster bacterium Io17-Chloro-G6]|nr:MAG: histidinol-phosphate transaminase [SAR202 cluster bacterium Io17-Chloro-G6]